MTKTIINGDPAGVIDISDRGLNYGDGFFTTAKVCARQIELWPLHQQRLASCAKRLGFGELDFCALDKDINQLLEGDTTQHSVLKVMYTRGNGGRGYTPPSDAQPTRVVRLLPYPESYHEIGKVGVTLSVAKTRLAQQPLLAGLKTLNRLEQVFIKQEAAQQSSDDLLVLDTTDNVIETSSANLVMYHQGQWFTPELTQAGIQGVYLSHLQHRLAITSCKLSLAQLFTMEAVFCCNSLMGLVPVTRIAHHSYNLDISQSLMAKYGISVC
ncbi:aminodeoxychorismate lyase [Pseudoalteromonas sp. SSDWG2]|uniref:aminodeoxychorismate lyase n=1 Tax=Pseudoalteromonas sp. SSDWG2 TaxID=3139391 RepID=UPI003BAACB79